MDADPQEPPQPSPATFPSARPNPTPKSITIRNPPFTYFHLTLLTTTANTPPLDILAARAHLTSALQQFLGVTGTAVPVDFLKVGSQDAWVRVPREDGPMVRGALSGWVGGDGVAWRVVGSADWLGALVAGTGRDLFER